MSAASATGLGLSMTDESGKRSSRKSSSLGSDAEVIFKAGMTFYPGIDEQQDTRLLAEHVERAINVFLLSLLLANMRRYASWTCPVFVSSIRIIGGIFDFLRSFF